MDRRSFLINSALPLAASGFTACSGSDNKTNDSDRTKESQALISGDGSLAGKPLQEWRDRFQHDLFERFLPFFLEHMVDYKHGGFFPYNELDGRSRSGDTKRAWWLGRGIWTVSYLYNHIDRQDKYLDIASHAAAILIKNKPSGDDFWPSPFEHSGVPAKAQAPSLYEDMFAAEGLAELAEATGNSEMRALAKETVMKCMRRYESPDYVYTSTYGLDIEPLKAPSVLGHWMVFLNTCSQMLRYEDDKDLRWILQRSTEALLNHHLNPEFDLMNEIINHDLSRPDNGFEYFFYTSHALETSWMLMQEAERTQNAPFFIQSNRLFQRHVEFSWDPLYDGVYAGIEHIKENSWMLNKSMWAQVEVMLGCLISIEHSGSIWAQEMFWKTYGYFDHNYSLEKEGCPLWLLGGNRDLSEKRPGTGDYYHNARWLMMSIQALDRMIERGGRVSGLDEGLVPWR